MSDLSKEDYRRIFYEEMGWDDKLEKLKKSEETVGASNSGPGKANSNVQTAKGS
jgi:hypothetical protein